MIPSTPNPTVKLDKLLKLKLLKKFEEEGNAIMHCACKIPGNGKIRISRFTVLFDLDNGRCIRMLHALNIPIAPKWKNIKTETTLTFTLIFAPLPKNCTLFDLVEHNHSSNGLNFTGIKRNNQDVYFLSIS
jgi:hypothetical protein